MASVGKPRLFLDANVIFSGLKSAEGPPGKLIDLYVAGEVTAVVSRLVIDETLQSIQRKIPESLAALRKLLLAFPPEIVDDPPVEEVNRWSKTLASEDAAVLAAAIAAQPDYFVTGDRDFLRNPIIAEASGIRIVTPGECLKRLKAK